MLVRNVRNVGRVTDRLDRGGTLRLVLPEPRNRLAELLQLLRREAELLEVGDRVGKFMVLGVPDELPRLRRLSAKIVDVQPGVIDVLAEQVFDAAAKGEVSGADDARPPVVLVCVRFGIVWTGSAKKANVVICEVAEVIADL